MLVYRNIISSLTVCNFIFIFSEIQDFHLKLTLHPCLMFTEAALSVRTLMKEGRTLGYTVCKLRQVLISLQSSVYCISFITVIMYAIIYFI